MSATNVELARRLNEIADLLDLGGERFKPEAYRRAARTIESLVEDVRDVAARGELESLPGVGEAIAEKAREFLRDGRIGYHERLRQQFSQGLLDLLGLPGLGPKTVRRFSVELGVEGPAELQRAIEQGRLDGLKGFGARRIELLRAALASASTAGRRTPLAAAFVTATAILRHLTERAPVDRVALAGSLRRRREHVGDLDILATSREPEKVFDAFSALPGISEVRLRGGTKETVVVDGGLQVDLRVVAPAAFGAALQYFTGSKDHNVHLRTLARDLGLKVNEYGVYRGEERIAGATEEEVYSALGLAWIPPELREDRGEIEAARDGRLPRLVEPGDVRGDLHQRLAEPPPPGAIEALVERAERLGLNYVGLCLPASLGPTPSPPAWARALRRVGGRGPDLLLGVESESPPSAADFDYWVLLLDSSGPPPSLEGFPPALAVRPLPPTPGPSERAPALTVPAGVPLDVGPDGPESTTLRQHLQGGGRLHLSVLASRDGVDLNDLVVGTARRAWATAAQVANASPEAPLPPPKGGAAARSSRRRS